MANKNLPSPELLRKLLRYEPDTGKLFWLFRPVEMFPTLGHSKTWNTKNANKIAFTAKKNDGYHIGRINGVGYRAHRVIWALHYGEWPEHEVDHVNGIRHDNRIKNLRLATSSQNKCNQTKRSDNTSGHKGVSWLKRERLWLAHVTVNGVMHRIGYFRNLDDAVAARKDAATRAHLQYYREG